MPSRPEPCCPQVIVGAKGESTILAIINSSVVAIMVVADDRELVELVISTGALARASTYRPDIHACSF